MKRCVLAGIFCLLLFVISHVHAQPAPPPQFMNLGPIVRGVKEDVHPTGYDAMVQQTIWGQDGNPLFNVAVVVNDDSRIAQYLHYVRSMFGGSNSWIARKLQQLTEFVKTDSKSIGIISSLKYQAQDLHAAEQKLHADMQQLKADMQRLLATEQELEASGQDSTHIRQELEANRQNSIRQEYRSIKQKLRTIRNAEWKLWNSALETLSGRKLPFEYRGTIGMAPSGFKCRASRDDIKLPPRQEDTQDPRATSTTPNIFLANLDGVKSAFNYVSILLKDIARLSQPAKVEIKSVERPACAFLTRGRYILREQLLGHFPDFDEKVKLQIDLHSIQNEETWCRESILPPSTLYGNKVSITLHEAGHLLGLGTFHVPHDDRPHTFFAGARGRSMYRKICNLLDDDLDAIIALCKAYFNHNLGDEDKKNIQGLVYESLHVSNARELMCELQRKYPADYPDLYPTNKVNLSSIKPEHADEFIAGLAIKGVSRPFFEDIIEKGDDSDPSNMISFVKIKVQGLAQYLLGKFHNRGDEEEQQIQDLEQGFKVVPTPEGVEMYPVAEPNSFVEHLLDSFGNPSAPNMEIVQGDFSDPHRFTLLPDGYAFFCGENVTQVLQNRPLSIVSEEGKNLNPLGIVGVPILGFERGIPGLGHIELRNCLMSHQSFRNYGIFTKLELAVLRDLGYPIDLENFWGYSIYGDSGTYTLGEMDSFCARVPVVGQPGRYEYEIETSNTTPLTVGLHVYGHNNTVRLVDGRVLQSGNGSAGIRVDGWENIVEIGSSTRIISNGEDGTGLMVCYGKDHCIHQAGTIIAKSIGALFSFGGNVVGLTRQQIGSFINTKVFPPNTFVNSVLQEETSGPLVKCFEVTGHLEGREAIHIARNAYVDTIAIEASSKVIGDIVNEWNPFEPFVQYDDRTRHLLHPRIYFGARRDESTDSLVADSLYNGTFIGNIVNKSSALDVCLMGGTLNWGRRDDYQEMATLERFCMCRGTCLRLESDFAHIAAKELMFEPDTTIIAPSRRGFKMHIEVPKDVKWDCGSVTRNVSVKFCDSGKESFKLGCSTEEPNTDHPESRIFKFFEQCLKDFFVDDSWDVDDF
jgi:hypothetical protein